MDDAALLQAFVGGAQDAFAELVRRHVGMVFGVCRRKLRDEHWAEDVTQAVFVLLARKADRFKEGVVVGGWLYKTAVYACANAQQMRVAREYHEKQVKPMESKSQPDSVEQAEVAGLLDTGLARLSPAQREVVVLRFLRQMTVAEVAHARRQTVYATNKTLEAGLGRLRSFLAQRGVTVTVVALGTMLGVEAARAAPMGLAAKASSAALCGTAGLSAPVGELVNGLLKGMRRMKWRMGMMAATAGLLLTTAALALGWGGGPGGQAAVRGGSTGVSASMHGGEAGEIADLWGTLAQLERALRTMDEPKISRLIVIPDPQEAQRWLLMEHVFAADYALKQTVATRFGRTSAALTDMDDFATRLDAVLPQVDRTTLHWTITPEEAMLRWGFCAGASAHASTTAPRSGAIYFVKRAGQWAVDAGRTVAVVIEGQDGLGKRRDVSLLGEQEQRAVEVKMEALAAGLSSITAGIKSGEVDDMDKARSQLAHLAEAGRGTHAFFRLALRDDPASTDGTEQIQNAQR